MARSHGWADEPEPDEALYHLTEDPDATRNLVGEDAFQNTLIAVRRRLDQHMGQTEDPLLTLGHVPPWPGMKTTPIDARYPGEPTIPAESLFPPKNPPRETPEADV